MTKIVALDSVKHRKLKIKADPTLKFSKNHHFVPIVVHEIPAAAHEFPLMFLKDSKADKYRLCAILGLKNEQNLCYSEKGWRAGYIPAAIRSYPFAMVAHPEDADQRILCIDEDADWLNEEEGQPLFDEEGNKTEFVDNIGNFVLDFQNKAEQTENFIADLRQHDLIVEKALQIGNDESNRYQINGIHTIDEKKFNELPDEVYLEFRKKGYIGPIYAILMSTSRVSQLLKFAAQEEQATAEA